MKIEKGISEAGIRLHALQNDASKALVMHAKQTGIHCAAGDQERWSRRDSGELRRHAQGKVGHCDFI